VTFDISVKENQSTDGDGEFSDSFRDRRSSSKKDAVSLHGPSVRGLEKTARTKQTFPFRAKVWENFSPALRIGLWGKQNP